MSDDDKPYSHAEADEMVRMLARSDFHEIVGAEKGDAFHAYRRRWAEAGRFELETEGPLHIDFELSTSCNFKCAMCPFGVPREERPPAFNSVTGQLSFDLFRKVIDEAVPLGLCAINLGHYNEPLLRKDLERFVRYAADAGVLDTMITTNGSLLTPERADSLIDSGLTRLMVSLDAATEETFRKIRIGGDFEQVTNNLRHLLKRRRERGLVLPLVRTSFCKSTLNEHELDAFLAQWMNEVDYIGVQELIEFGPPTDGLKPASRIVNDDFRCHHPWHRVTVRADGTTLPCCTAWGHQLPLGNVSEQTVESIWKSDAMRELRALHREGRYRDNDVCRQCAEATVVEP
jgi:radical SAM protein with 4Fe4S-binding SPASM domain